MGGKHDYVLALVDRRGNLVPRPSLGVFDPLPGAAGPDVYRGVVAALSVWWQRAIEHLHGAGVLRVGRPWRCVPRKSSGQPALGDLWSSWGGRLIGPRGH